MNVLKLCQNPAHAHMLITGGTEGQAKFWVSYVPSRALYSPHPLQ